MTTEEKWTDHQSAQATLAILLAWNSRIAPSLTSFSIKHRKARPGPRRASLRSKPPLASASQSRSQSSSRARIPRSSMHTTSYSIKGQLSSRRRLILRSSTKEWWVGEPSRHRRIIATTWWTDLRRETTCRSSSNPSNYSVRNTATRSTSRWDLQLQDLVGKARPSNQVCNHCSRGKHRPKSKVRPT